MADGVGSGAGGLRGLKPEAGWFTRAFCEDARYFHPDNGARIDAMRSRIEAMGLEPELKAVVLVSLMEAADRVDSTAGVQMAYMKRWVPRALKPLQLRLPDILPSVGTPCLATRADAVEIAGQVEADLVYLDPPYNQHSYLGNYHVWESLVLWDQPETYGVANKRIDVRTRKSAFNSRPGIGPAALRGREGEGAEPDRLLQRRGVSEPSGPGRDAVRARARAGAGNRPSALHRRAHRHPQSEGREGRGGRTPPWRRAPVRGHGSAAGTPHRRLMC